MTGGIARRCAWANLWLVAALSCTIAVATFWPGHLDTDSVHQLEVARMNVEEAWPPPLLSKAWRVLDRIEPGAGGMLIFQNAMFFAGVALLVGAALGPGWAFLVPAIGFFPPILALLNTIYRDTQMGCAFALAFGLLAWAELRAARWPLFCAPVLLLYAVGVRYNAMLAALPAYLWWGGLARRAWFSGRRAAAGRFAGVALMVLSQGAVLAWFSGAIRRGAYEQVGVTEHDLAAISLDTGKNLFPETMVRRGVSLEVLRRNFRTDSADLLSWGPDASSFRPANPGDSAMLQRCWLAAIAAHPLAYLRHRLGMLARQLGAPRTAFFMNDMSWMSPGFVPLKVALGVNEAPGPADRLAMRFLMLWPGTLLFRGWIYLCIAIVALAFPAVRAGPTFTPCRALAWSSILMAAPLLFIDPSAEFRYVWWCVIAGLLLPVTVASGWLGGKARIPATNATSASSDASTGHHT
ncbi:MAG TPA: hypothetical protein VI356_04390 [Myxococcales bacterium]